MDAQLRVCVAPDAMSATLRVPGAFPRQMLTAELIFQSLREAGVLVSREATAAVSTLVAAPPKAGQDAEIVIAKGVAPSNGTPAVLTWTIDQERADAVKTFYDRTPYVTVSVGTVVGKVTPATSGTDGVNVRGETLKARHGAALAVQLRGGSLELRPDGTIVSFQGGLLIRSATAAWVGKVLPIETDVDFSSGNIDFDGDVAIRGGIKDTFKVKATGSVTVDGPIGAATIECGGDLIVRYGAAGSFKGTISVGGELAARYLEAVSGLVKGNARIERDVIDCDLVIEGTCLSPGASMISGRMTVAGEAAFKVVGSRASAKTRLVLGSLKAQDEAQHKAMVELEAATAGLKALQAEYDILLARGKTLSPAQRERQTELQFEVSELTSKRDACLATIAMAKAVSGEKCSVGLDVKERLHEGTTLCVLGVDYHIRNDIDGPLRITASGGQAMISFGLGPARPLSSMIRRAA